MKNKPKPLPSQAELHKLFHCVGGKLIRNAERHPRSYGKVVGNDNGRGYSYVMINRQNFLIHRLIWMWFMGTDPGDNEVDHIDKNPSNNNIWNLQVLPYLEHVEKDSKGYSYNARWKKWVIYKWHNGRNVQVAKFDTEEECKLHLSNSNSHKEF